MKCHVSPLPPNVMKTGTVVFSVILLEVTSGLSGSEDSIIHRNKSNQSPIPPCSTLISQDTTTPSMFPHIISHVTMLLGTQTFFYTEIIQFAKIP